MFTVYTDGSTLKNGKKNAKGGWCYYIKEEKEGKEPTEYFEARQVIGTTNNQMEMTAIQKALQILKQMKKTGEEIHLYSDSEYCIRILEKVYTPHKNLDFWEKIFGLFKEFSNIHLHWVKGHASDVMNNFVDEMARKMASGVSTSSQSESLNQILEDMQSTCKEEEEDYGYVITQY